MQVPPVGRSCRVTPIVAALTLSLMIAGCTSASGGHATTAASQNTSPTTPNSASGSAPTSGLPTSTPPAPVPPKTSTIVIPPNLCAATDIAQNTADAYMGALSAGDEAQALKCVFPHTVPGAVTHGLVAHVSGTAVYLPAGRNGPTVFGYKGNGKTVLVTVTREADHKTWVTKVDVT
ncbi:MAG: hypothetical protein QOG22_1958 [Pseudonocardiales bacterium]|nr:hypothetical protein [Pseudonocardiales bacterium]